MGELNQALIKSHERHIRLLKDELNQLYAQDKRTGNNSKDKANEILSDIKKHRDEIKTLTASQQ